MGGISRALRGSIDPVTGISTIIATGAPNWNITFTLDLSGSSSQLSGSITQVAGGVPGDMSEFIADRDSFSAAEPVPLQYRGIYTMILPSRDTQFTPVTNYPRGTGLGNVTIGSNGSVTVVGTLADGTSVNHSSNLSRSLTWPFFASFAGSISGLVQVNTNELDSDINGQAIAWYLLPGANTYYPDGWQEGIIVDMYSSRLSTAPGQSILRNLGPGNTTTPNADLVFSLGGLTTPVPTALYISPTNVVTRFPAADPSYSAAFTVSNGQFAGFFPHTNGQRNNYRGIVFQKGPRAGGYGYFLSVQDTGSVSLLPK
jgi:hypothetical protein